MRGGDPYAALTGFAATSNRSSASNLNLHLLADVASADVGELPASAAQDVSLPRTSKRKSRPNPLYMNAAAGMYDLEEATESDEHGTFVVADRHADESLDPGHDRRKRLKPQPPDSLPCAPASCQRARSSARQAAARGRGGQGAKQHLDGFASFATKYRDVLQHADAQEAEAVYSMVVLTQGGLGAPAGNTHKPYASCCQVEGEEAAGAAVDRSSPPMVDSSDDKPLHPHHQHHHSPVGGSDGQHSAHGGPSRRGGGRHRPALPQDGAASDTSSKSVPVGRKRGLGGAAAPGGVAAAGGGAGVAAAGHGARVAAAGGLLPHGFAAGGLVAGPGGMSMSPQLMLPKVPHSMMLAPMMLPAAAMAAGGARAVTVSGSAAAPAAAGHLGLAGMAAAGPYGFPGPLLALPPGMATGLPGMPPFLAPPWVYPPGAMMYGLGAPFGTPGAAAGGGVVSAAGNPVGVPGGTAVGGAPASGSPAMVASSGMMMLAMPPPLMPGGAPYLSLAGGPGGQLMGVGLPVTVSAPGTVVVPQQQQNQQAGAGGSSTARPAGVGGPQQPQQQQQVVCSAPVQGVPLMPPASVALPASAAAGVAAGSAAVKLEPGMASYQQQAGSAQGLLPRIGLPPAQGVPVMMPPHPQHLKLPAAGGAPSSAAAAGGTAAVTPVTPPAAAGAAAAMQPSAAAAADAAVVESLLASADLSELKAWVGGAFGRDVYLMLLDVWRPDSPKVREALRAWKQHVLQPRAVGEAPDYRAFLVSVFGLELLMQVSALGKQQQQLQPLRQGQGLGSSGDSSSTGGEGASPAAPAVAPPAAVVAPAVGAGGGEGEAAGAGALPRTLSCAGAAGLQVAAAAMASLVAEVPPRVTKVDG